MDRRVFASPAARRSAVLRLVVLGVGGAILLGLVYEFVPFVLDPEWLRETVEGFGPYAPLAFVSLQAAQVALAPIPGQVLGFVGGFLFGGLRGAFYSIVGVTLGSAAVFAVARRFGRPYVERVLHADALDDLDGFVDRYGTLGLFLAFLFPLFPDDVLCAVAGLTELRGRTLLVLVVVGRTPTFLAVAVAGGELAAESFVRVGLVVGALALATLLVYLKRETLLAALERRQNS